MIKQLLNSVFAKYRELSVARRSIICLCLRHRQIIDLLSTDKSRYFAQPRPIVDNYLLMHQLNRRLALRSHMTYSAMLDENWAVISKEKRQNVAIKFKIYRVFHPTWTCDPLVQVAY